MREITKLQFYDYVNPRDICVYCFKTSPMAESEWKTRSGVLIGKTIHDYNEYDMPNTKYYLLDELCPKDNNKEGKYHE